MPCVTTQSFLADPHAADAAAEHDLVFITEGDQPRRVLINITEYRRLAETKLVTEDALGESKEDLATLLAIPDEEFFEWDPPRLDSHLFEPADLS